MKTANIIRLWKAYIQQSKKIMSVFYYWGNKIHINAQIINVLNSFLYLLHQVLHCYIIMCLASKDLLVNYPALIVTLSVGPLFYFDHLFYFRWRTCFYFILFTDLFIFLPSASPPTGPSCLIPHKSLNFSKLWGGSPCRMELFKRRRRRIKSSVIASPPISALSVFLRSDITFYLKR